ncbi:MarR family transcriptional regulator [Aquamicrobium sp. NLF2-7]|uniref:MarR family winged helix-turn-helix transcriptional regulator n=1 Tax=Aquamicrobium sp. NLF2-7 TaxID=2918753 RepID=UPI001EFC061E|nr:MarR family transcriptional regulator [Aquamicrobium sp. NLF2-7]MCG8274118.1 MarR family transcriptional regulator [Aquamicrobium sp. NLF2-7]
MTYELGTGAQPAQNQAVGKPVELGVLSNLVTTYLHLVLTAAETTLDRRMRDHVLGPGKGKLSSLSVIANNPGISQVELARLFGRNRSTQFRIIRDLEKRGVVRSEVDPTERRRHNIHLTPLGEQLSSELDVIIGLLDEQVFSVLSESEYKSFLESLKKLCSFNVDGFDQLWTTSNRYSPHTA